MCSHRSENGHTHGPVPSCHALQISPKMNREMNTRTLAVQDMEHEPDTQTVGVRATASRRQFRLSISSDMEDIWRQLKDVRPRGDTRELEWLLRLGILAESGLRAGGPAFATFMAGIAAPQPGLGRASMLGGGQFQPESAAQEGASQRRTEGQLDSVPAAESGEARVEQVAGWNFARGFKVAAAVEISPSYSHSPSSRTHIRKDL